MRLEKPTEAKELRDRGARYRAKLATMWDEKAGIFLNKDLHTGQFESRGFRRRIFIPCWRTRLRRSRRTR